MSELTDAQLDALLIRKRADWVAGTLKQLADDLDNFGDAAMTRACVRKAQAALAVTLKHCGVVRDRIERYMAQRGRSAGTLGERIVDRMAGESTPPASDIKRGVTPEEASRDEGRRTPLAKPVDETPF